jgi:hypothetical protein
MIGDRVVSDIINAELVVADLTELNPNAFYELGIRHSTEKSTIHVAKSGTVLPFDNIAHRTIFFDLMDWQSIESARARLGDSVRATKAPGYRVSNPITQANASFKMRQSEDPRDRVIAEMQERMSALENSLAKMPSRVEYAQYNSPTVAPLTEIKLSPLSQAIKTYRTLTGAGLLPAKQVVEALRDGKKTDATRLHRTATGQTPIDSKKFIESFEQFLPAAFFNT